MSEPLRAVVIGASGMGKHHAKWLHQLGCEVVGFAGTSAASVERTTQLLHDIFPFEGTGYTDVARMLETEQPDVVAVASPNEYHYEHVMLALQHGAHVICEKALVQDWDKNNDQLLAEAQALAQAADEAGVVTAVNTQYVAAAAAYQDLAEQVGVSELVSQPKSFFMQMESRGGAEGTDHEQIWIDLAPHPLSVLRAMVGPGQIDPESQSVRVARRWVNAHFDLIPDDGGAPVRAHILVRNVPEGPLTRRLGLNDLLADYEGRNNAEGVYASFMTLCGVEREYTDFMQVSLTRFIQAVHGEGKPLATFADGVTDLERLLGLLAEAKGLSAPASN